MLPRTGRFLRFVFAFFTFESKQPSRSVRSRYYDFVPSTSGDGPGASSVRAFLNPASSSQRLISLREKVSPLSVLTSILTANIKPFSGGPFIVDQPFADGNGAAGFERVSC